MDRMTWEEYAAKNPNLLNQLSEADLKRLEGEVEKNEDRLLFYEKLMDIGIKAHPYEYALRVGRNMGVIK